MLMRRIIQKEARVLDYLPAAKQDEATTTFVTNPNDTIAKDCFLFVVVVVFRLHRYDSSFHKKSKEMKFFKLIM